MLNNCYWKDRAKVHMVDFFLFYGAYVATIFTATFIFLLIYDMVADVSEFDINIILNRLQNYE